MFCNKCGNQLEEGQMFCDRCGEKVIQYNSLNNVNVGYGAAANSNKNNYFHKPNDDYFLNSDNQDNQFNQDVQLNNQYNNQYNNTGDSAFINDSYAYNNTQPMNNYYGQNIPQYPQEQGNFTPPQMPGNPYNPNTPPNMNNNFKKKGSRKGVIILCSILAFLAIASVATVFIVKHIKSKKNYAAEAQKTTANVLKGSFKHDASFFDELSDDDYEDIYDDVKDYFEVDGVSNGSEFKKFLLNDLREDEEYDEYYGYYEDEIKIVEKSETSFKVYEDEDYYDEISIGNAVEVSDISDSDLIKNFSFGDYDVDDFDEELDDEIVVETNLIKNKMKSADKIYKVPVEFKQYEDGVLDYSVSFYDIVYVKDGKCNSIYRFIFIYEYCMAYLPKSTKSNDVASGKTIKTAVETAMSSEDTYCYLTGTDDYSYIYIYPGSTSENDIVLDVDYIPNEYYGIVSSDVEGDIKREIFNNIG